MAALTRYLVRKATQQVYIWTEMLSRRKDLEEVHATNPTEALKKRAIPLTEKVTLDQIEEMGKEDLILFSAVRLGTEIDQRLTRAEMQDLVKEKLMLRPTEQAMLAAQSAGPFMSAAETKMKSGMVVAPPARIIGNQNARVDVDKSLQP